MGRKIKRKGVKQSCHQLPARLQLSYGPVCILTRARLALFELFIYLFFLLFQFTIFYFPSRIFHICFLLRTKYRIESGLPRPICPSELQSIIFVWVVDV